MTEFKVIVADAPWSFRDSLPGESRGAAKNYAIMTLDDIKGFLEKESIKPAKDCLLFLWRVSALSEEALQVVRAWGFTPKSELVWVKTPRLPKGTMLPPGEEEEIIAKHKIDSAVYAALLKTGLDKATVLAMMIAKAESELGDKLHFGMGHYTRNSHETCIIAARGKTKELIRDRSIRSVFFAPTGEHSEKPRLFYEIVERISTTPRIELFARTRRMGWTSHGLELDGRIAIESKSVQAEA